MVKHTHTHTLSNAYCKIFIESNALCVCQSGQPHTDYVLTKVLSGDKVNPCLRDSLTFPGKVDLRIYPQHAFEK